MSGRPGMKLGRLAPKVHAKTLLLDKYLLPEALPAPPEKAYWEYKVGETWPMMLNDSLGDCTCADAGHRVMLWTAHSGALVTPTDEQVLDVYKAVGGYVPGDPSTDNGCAMTDVFDYCRTTGIAGHKIDGWVQVDFTNLRHVRQAIYLFGHLSIGVNLPNSAMDQFEAGTPWNLLQNDGGIDGGHDIPIFGYGADGFTCVTWGKLQQIGIRWFETYVEEAYAAVSVDWIMANGDAPNMLNMEALTEDLRLIKGH